MAGESNLKALIYKKNSILASKKVQIFQLERPIKLGKDTGRIISPTSSVSPPSPHFLDAQPARAAIYCSNILSKTTRKATKKVSSQLDSRHLQKRGSRE